MARPGTMLAHALLAAAHPQACFSKACSSAMHTTAEPVGQQGTHTHAHTQACTHIRSHTHSNTRARTQIHTLMHANTHTRAYTHIHATRTRTHRHARIALTVLMGFANFSASLATLPHLPSFLSYAMNNMQCLEITVI